MPVLPALLPEVLGCNGALRGVRAGVRELSEVGPVVQTQS
jgi:hypothetical protein